MEVMWNFIAKTYSKKLGGSEGKLPLWGDATWVRISNKVFFEALECCL